MSKQTGWRAVTSKNSLRAGEVFILHDDTFVMKLYPGATADNEAFAYWLVGQLRRANTNPQEVKTR